MTETMLPTITEAQRTAVLEYLRNPTPSAARKLRLAVPARDAHTIERIGREGYHHDCEISVRYGLPLGDPAQWHYRAARAEDLRPGTRFEYQDGGDQVVLIRHRPDLAAECWEVARISQRTGEAHRFDWARGDMLLSSVKFALIVEGLPLIWDPRVPKSEREVAERSIVDANEV